MSDSDVIVIGGGPAGIFAAGYAALQGVRVTLLEKNPRLGAKLRITGKGRCNVTNSEADVRAFAERFGDNGKSLLTALYAYGVAEVVDFFEQRGLSLTVERGGRIFPSRGGAREVQQVLDAFLHACNVELRCGCEVQGLLREEGRIVAVRTDKGTLPAQAVLVATGGLSYPETGCTGDGYRWAQELGLAVVRPEPALTGIALAETWTGEVCDLNLKHVEIKVLQHGKVLAARFGEAFFTRDGLGGPIVLDMSNVVRTSLEAGPVELVLDFKPAVTRELFDKRLQRELSAHANKDFANALGRLLPKTLIPLFVKLSGIDPATKCHSVTRAQRRRLLELFKGLRLQVKGCGGFDKAIVTRGGIDLREVDMRTLRAKRYANLYFAGEVLDLDGPTGGFNLQVCWSTGYLAGISMAERVRAAAV